jgi:hypothetical protein
MWVGISLSLLICLNVLTAAAVTHPQRGADKAQLQPSYLYQVSSRDKGRMRFGFIDRSGKLVIDFDRLPERTVAVGEFREGRAVIYLGKTKEDVARGYMNYTVGYIDVTGKMIIVPRFDVARDFSEGLAYVEEDAQGFKGFINLEGKVVIKLDDDLIAKDFHDGRAAVGMSKGNRKWGYIDRSGRVVVERRYEFADDFSEGLAGVAVDRKYGFINKAGEMVVAPRFELRTGQRHRNVIISSGRFSEGLACVNVANTNELEGLYGYIDKRGEFVVPPQFSYAQDFSEGLAWVVKNRTSGVAEKAGWIDKTGRWAVTSVQGRTIEFGMHEFFSYAGESHDWRYSEGLVPFFVYLTNATPKGDAITALWGYMDKSGREVIKPGEFYQVGPFTGGIAWVAFYGSVDSGLKEEYGYINNQGRFIWRSKN